MNTQVAIVKAIKHFENMRDENYIILNQFKQEIESGKVNGSTLVYDNRNEYYNLAIEALREKQARENPVALTLEQLRGRNGKPVWVEEHGEWALVSDSKGAAESVGTIYRFEFYADGWTAYDYPPKEDESK